MARPSGRRDLRWCMVDPLRLVRIIFLCTEKEMARFQDEKATEKTPTKNPLAIGFCLLQTSYHVE
jgi:hypothetical protein